MARLSAPVLSEDQRFSCASGPESAPSVATARELALALGPYEIDDLQAAQPELAAAVTQLALAAGKAWPVGVDDPLVLLLLTLARVSIESPDATSTAAAELLTRYGPARR